MLPMPILKEPCAVILKFVVVVVFCMISASARDISDVCKERDDMDFSISFSARVVLITRFFENFRVSPGASGIVAHRSPAWYSPGSHFWRYVIISPKL